MDVGKNVGEVLERSALEKSVCRNGGEESSVTILGPPRPVQRVPSGSDTWL
jgi:hypothetical protein